MYWQALVISCSNSLLNFDFFGLIKRSEVFFSNGSDFKALNKAKSPKRYPQNFLLLLFKAHKFAIILDFF